MGTCTVILGGGVGGVVTANTLRALLPQDHEIVLIEKKAAFNLGAAKTWVALGHRTPAQVTRPLSALRKRGIRVIQAEARKIDAARREVKTSEATVQGDALVVALGASLNWGAVPGLEQAAQTFYTLDGAVRLGETLRNFKGGDVAILIPRTPIPCPPAPYEFALHLSHELKNARISLTTIEPAPVPTAGDAVSRMVRDALTERGIAYHPQKKAKSADAARRAVLFEDGSEARSDLLIAVPPHDVPSIVKECGLAGPAGWIPVDPRTMETAVERVYAIGDVTVVPLPGRYRPEAPLALPKAAVFAEAQARVVASRIAAQVLGRPASDAFEGLGFCWVETGDRRAIAGEGRFFEVPQPRVTPRPPDARALQEKYSWAEKFLQSNFDA